MTGGLTTISRIQMTLVQMNNIERTATGKYSLWKTWYSAGRLVRQSNTPVVPTCFSVAPVHAGSQAALGVLLQCKNSKTAQGM